MLIYTLLLPLHLIKNYISAVIAAAKPKKMPGALANAPGIFFGLAAAITAVM